MHQKVIERGSPFFRGGPPLARHRLVGVMPPEIHQGAPAAYPCGQGGVDLLAQGLHAVVGYDEQGNPFQVLGGGDALHRLLADGNPVGRQRRS